MNILFDNLESLIDAPNGIEKTRELILQLALQGKLTEQDPSDEPASELLKKINSSKIKFVKDNKIRAPQKKLINSSLTELTVPSSWEIVRVDDIINFITDFQANGSFASLRENVKYYSSQDYAVLVRLKDLRHDLEKSTDFVYTDKHGYDFLIKSSLSGGEILVANVGAGVGTTLVMPEIDRKATLAPNMFKIILNENVDKDFFLYFANSPLYWAWLNSFMKATAQPKMNKSEYASIIFPLPPLNEQKRIVEKVNSLMVLLDELEEKRELRNQKRNKLNNASLEKLLTSKDDKELKTNWKRIEENFSTLYSVQENVKKLKQAILQLAVQGKLVRQDPNDEPALELLKKIKKEKERLIAEGKIRKQNNLSKIKEEEKPFSLPKGWEWVRLGEIGLINPRNDIPDDLDVSFIPMALISEKYGEMAKSETRTWGEIKKGFTHFAENDIGLAKITPCFENGKAAVFTDLINGYGAGTTELHIFRKIIVEISSDFIYILIKSPFFVDGGKSKMTGTAGQQRVSKDYFQDYVFALPPSNEQKRVVEKVYDLMSLCNTLEEKLTKNEATAEKLVGAVVNAVANKTNKPKDDKKEVIKDLMDQHIKALPKLILRIEI